MDDRTRIVCIGILGFLAGGSLVLGAYLTLAQQEVPQFVTACLGSSLGGLLVLINTGRQGPQGPTGEHGERGPRGAPSPKA